MSARSSAAPPGRENQGPRWARPSSARLGSGRPEPSTQHSLRKDHEPSRSLRSPQDLGCALPKRPVASLRGHARRARTDGNPHPGDHPRWGRRAAKSDPKKWPACGERWVPWVFHRHCCLGCPTRPVVGAGTPPEPQPPNQDLGARALTVHRLRTLENAARTLNRGPRQRRPRPAPAAADMSRAGRRGRRARSATGAAAEARGSRRPNRVPTPTSRGQGAPRGMGSEDDAIPATRPPTSRQGTCPAAGARGWARNKDGDASGQGADPSWFGKAGPGRRMRIRCGHGDPGRGK